MRPVTMRLVPYEREDGTFTVVDWKTGPSEVLDEVSDLLAPYGLCIVLADTQDDSYRFKIGGSRALDRNKVAFLITDLCERHLEYDPEMGICGTGSLGFAAADEIVARAKTLEIAEAGKP